MFRHLGNPIADIGCDRFFLPERDTLQTMLDTNVDAAAQLEMLKANYARTLQELQHKMDCQRKNSLTVMQQNLTEISTKLQEAQESWTPFANIRDMKQKVNSMVPNDDDDTKLGA